MCFGVIQRFDRMMNKENGLLRKGQAVNLFIGAPFLSARDLSQYEVQLRVVGEQSDLKSAGQGFNASYKHLRFLFGSLRLPAYFGRSKGALNVFRRNTVLRQNDE